MADSFFGFDTAVSGPPDDDRRESPGHGMDEEEEEYDALNDETFGTDPGECDWEDHHEKLAEITELERVHRNSFNDSTEKEEEKNEDYEDLDGEPDLTLEARLSQLVLDDTDDPIVTSPKADSAPRNVHHFQSVPGVTDVGYSSSAPSGFSLWTPGKADTMRDPSILRVSPPAPRRNQTLGSLQYMMSVRTVEELERDLMGQGTPSSQQKIGSPGRPAQVVEQDRNLKSSARLVERDPTTPIGMGRGLSICPASISQDVLQKNSKNMLAMPVSFVSPRFPHLAQVSGNAAFGQVVVPSRLGTSPTSGHAQTFKGGINSHLSSMSLTDLGSPVHQLLPSQKLVTGLAQNRRLMGPSPNVLHFIPQMQRDGKPLHTFQQPYQNHIGRDGGFRSFQDQRNGPFLRPERSIFAHQNNMHGRREGGFYPFSQPRVFSRRDYENGSGDYDDYAGLMSQREKQWLMNIQILQLNSNQPFVDDYYYTVYNLRKSQEPGNKNKKELSILLSDRNRDKDKEHGRLEPRIYTPAQFENSLGKLQVVSVTAPRKIIDMDVVSADIIDPVQCTQRDSRKFRQLLLEVERLYLLLLELDDSENPFIEAKDTSETDKEELIQKLLASLLQEERLINVMCLRKGKVLVCRVFAHLPLDQQGGLWSRMMRGLSTIVRRDHSDQLLPDLYPHFRTWVETAAFPALLQLASSLAPSDMARSSSPVGTAKNTLVSALGNKFGVSVVVALIDRAESLYSSVEEKASKEWSTFIVSLIEAISLVAEIATPLEPIASLNTHLSHFSVKIEKYAALEKALASFKNEKSNMKNPCNY